MNTREKIELILKEELEDGRDKELIESLKSELSLIKEHDPILDVFHLTLIFHREHLHQLAKMSADMMSIKVASEGLSALPRKVNNSLATFVEHMGLSYQDANKKYSEVLAEKVMKSLDEKIETDKTFIAEKVIKELTIPLFVAGGAIFFSALIFGFLSAVIFTG